MVNKISEIFQLITTKSCCWWKSAAVELSFFLYTVVDTLLYFGNTNLYLQKACRAATVEPDLSTPCDDTEKGVIAVTRINTYILPFETFLVTISLIFYSFWSDRAGKKRKIFIIMAMVGLMLESGFEGLHSYWWSSTPVFAAITSVLVHILCGCRKTVFIFGNMYLADVVDDENRTMRLGIFSMVKTIGYLVGDLIHGNMLHTFGFVRYYLTCLAVASLATINGLFFIQDHSEQTQVISKSQLGIRHIVADSFSGILKKGSEKQRVVVTLALIVYTILLFIGSGQNSVIYLYLRYKFGWDEVMYSYFVLYECLAVTFGSFFSSVVLSRKLKIHDAVIGVLSSIWNSIIAINFILAKENWQLYFVSGINVCFTVSPTVCVSFITKFYDSSEMGHLFAVIKIFNLFTLFSQPAYNILLEKTLHDHPYSFFMFNFVLYFSGIILFSIIYKLSKHDSENITPELEKRISK